MSVETPELLRYLPAVPGRGWGDGYDWIDLVTEAPGWAVIPSWGLDGWDMGSWPYVIVATCTVAIPEDDRPVRQPPWCVHCRQPLRLLDMQVWASEWHGPDCHSTVSAHRPARQTRAYGVLTYVEGDLYVHAYAQHEDRIAALDETAAWYWRHQEHGPKDLPWTGPLAAEFCGPFSWDRVEAAKAEQIAQASQAREDRRLADG